MGIFSRFKSTPRERAAPDPAVRALAEGLIEFSAVAQRHHVTVDHTNVVGDSGALMERNAGRYFIHRISELPYPAEVIRAAQYVALNDPRYEGVKHHVRGAIFDLETYLSDEEVAPYRDALDAATLLFTVTATPELQRLLERDPKAAVDALAGLPQAESGALEPLHRLLRRRQSVRWAELVARFPHLFDTEERNVEFLHWMYAHAADVYVVLTEALAALRDAAGDMLAAERFKSANSELTALLDEASAYPEPVGADEKRKWELSRALSYHA